MNWRGNKGRFTSNRKKHYHFLYEQKEITMFYPMLAEEIPFFGWEAGKRVNSIWINRQKNIKSFL